LVLSPQDRLEASDLICRFQRSFDERDWSGLESCLASEVLVDYEDLRGAPPQLQTAASFCQLRSTALDHLDLQHNFTNLVVSSRDGTDHLVINCNFQIFRFERHGPRYFHSWGSYTFGVERSGALELRITFIKQRVVRNLGDSGIHGGAD